MENNIISKRVEIVRQKMRELGAAALVVPTSDPHDITLSLTMNAE